jgi:hypothetical protein
MKNLKYEDLVQLEQSFLKPTLEKVRKAIQTIFEGKTTRLVGSDFDKNIVFFVDKDLKTAKFEVNEDKVKIHSVDEVSVDSETFGLKFQSLMSEAIDLLSENKEADSKSKFNDAIEVLRRELSGDKTTIFDKRPPLCENKVAVRKIKLVKENKKQAIKDLSKNLSDIMESYYGKDVIKDTYFEVSLNEGKSNEVRKYEKEPSLLRKVDLAKKSAKIVDMKPIFENVQKWISENEEVFFLTSDKFKERLVEASKTNVSATKDKINEAVKTFMKLRSENEGFKKIADQILKEQTDEAPGGNTETEIGDDRATEPERDELDDKVVSDVDRKSEEDKLGFMRQFVDILEKLLNKIKEVSDEEEVQRRVDFAVDTINKAKEENRWDKDELAEIAKEAIELAAKVEGIEPVDTELSKRAEEEEEAGEMGKETISGEEGIPGGEEVGMEPEIGGEEEIPGEEEEEPIFKPRKKGLRGREEEIAEEAIISPDGDITYGDEEGFGGEPQAPEMEKLTCFNCEKDFSVEPDGAPSYKCPYCGEAVEGLGGEEAPVDIDKELAPVTEDDGMGNADQSSVNTVNEKEETEEDEEEETEEELDEAKMSTNPAVGKIESVGGTELADSGTKMSNKPNIQKKLMKNVEGSTEGIIDKSGEKMSTNPEKGTQKVVDGTKLPDGGKKMSKTPNKGTMKYAGGTKLPDSGKKMSKNPDIQKKLMKNVEGSTGEISDSGEKMTTFPAIGAIKTLKEQTQSFPSTQKKLMKPAAGTKITEKKEEEEEGQEQLDEKYMGFKKLVKSLKSKGIKGEKKEEDDEEMDDEEMNEAYQVFLKEGAEALAAWIGRKKYGKEKFQQMSKAGKGEEGAEVEESGPALADDDEEMETPGEVGGEEIVGTEVGTDEVPAETDDMTPSDVEPVGSVAPEADIAPIDTEVGPPEADIAPAPEAGIAPEVDIAVGGAEVDVVVDSGSQTSGKLPDTGEQMSTNPPVGEIETVGETGEAIPPVVRYGDEDANTKPGEGQAFEEEGAEESEEGEEEEEYTEEELVEAWNDMNSDKKFLRECRAHKKMNEVAPPGWEGTVKAMKKHKDITNPWALAWHMKGKGMKSHKNECMKKPFKKAMRKSMKSVEEIEEARAKLQQMQEKVEKEQNTPHCSSCKKETADLYEDPKTWGAISSKGQEYLCLECMRRDFPYMVKDAEEVEETENTEANVEEASYLPKDADVLGTYGSKSNPERKYYIVKGKDGVTYCTCPAWKFSKDQPKCCKHLQDFTGGGSGRVTDENNEEFIREMNSPAIDPFEEETEELSEDDKPYTEGPGAKAAGTALPDKAKPFTVKPVRKITEDDKPYTEGPGRKAAGTALHKKAKPFTVKPTKKVNED